MNIEDAQALVGQTFGSGNTQRTITRIENLHTTDNYTGGMILVGEVYWKRPGGNERAVYQWLPYFLTWMKKAERDANRLVVECIADVEAYLSEIPEGTLLDGFINREGDEITMVFTLK